MKNDIVEIAEIKSKVLEKVAEYAFLGTLEQNKEKIPYEIISGIKPNFRCCVYKEREIIHQRVRLAMGKLPIDAEYENLSPSQMVHVIPCACHGCPITRFTVTSNCQNCLTKKCIKVCKFGAIERAENKVFINKNKCRKCGMCVEACPYSAIVDTERPCKKHCIVDAIDMDKNDLAIIDTSKCINCGMCIHNCPFGAITDVSMLVNVISDLQSGKKVYAMLAPSIEGQFGDYDIGVLKAAVKSLGFTQVFEVAQGAEKVAKQEAEELLEKIAYDEVMTSSCCPSFVNLIQKNFPSLIENISKSVSPMVETAKMIREIDSEATTVFIGPCVAKKNEMLSKHIDLIDGVLTFEELLAIFKAKKIRLDDYEQQEQFANTYAKGFAKSGGVAKAVLEQLRERGIDKEFKVEIANGLDEAKKALLLIKAGKLNTCFLEGMGCKGGCLNGTARLTELSESKKIFDKMQLKDNKTEL